MSDENIAHIVLVPLMAWGMTRPICVLAARLVSEKENIIVTFVASPNLYDKTIAEITRQFPSRSNDKRFQRIRVVSILRSDEPDSWKLLQPFNESYGFFYKALSSGEPITCAISGTTFSGVPAPRMVIVDFIAYSILNTTRSITGHAVPVIACMHAHASCCIRVFGPESLGGLGDLGSRAEAESKRTGKPADEIAEAMYSSRQGSVINVPGIPAMYDYEFVPQDVASRASLLPLVKDGQRTMRECDGALLASIGAYDGEGLDAVRLWFSEDSRKAHSIGPLMPDPSSESDMGRGNQDVSTFLQTTLDRHGRKSLVYISFGSSSWPASTDYLEEAVAALIEKKFPFIFCAASLFATFPQGFKDKIESSGLGLLTKWGPQQYILNHPSTGWFISHCGHGSSVESLTNGIPLICWPFEADQPDAAAHLSQTLKVGFELMEVKSFVGRPAYRDGRAPQGSRAAVRTEFREILEKCRGKEGEVVRHNAEMLKDRLSAAWDENGVAKKELHSFLDSYL